MIVVSKSQIKRKKCPECFSDLRKEYLVCPRKDDPDYSDYLLSYRCDACQQNYMHYALYEAYKRNNNTDTIKFLIPEKVYNEQISLEDVSKGEGNSLIDH